MGSVVIRRTLFDKLKAIADATGLPVETQAEMLLEDGIVRWEDRQKLVGQIDRIAAMTPKDVVQTDSVVLLREDRDR